MFNKALREMLEHLRKRVSSLENNLVECEKCGCLLRIETAFKGKSTIIEIIDLNNYPEPIKEIIGAKYYCKIHKPKK